MNAANALYYGDNLEVLRQYIADESVDLSYIAPPFNSKRNYNQIYNNVGNEDRAQAQAFMDTWTWDAYADSSLDEILGNDEGRYAAQVVDLVRGLALVLKKGSLSAYIVSMTQCLAEIHRVLKPQGSFYLPCGPTASHYLKLLLDAVFVSKGGQFQNEIAWCYTIGGKSKKRFGRNHDVIFFYTKSNNDQHTFNKSGAAIPRKAQSHMKVGIDEDGRTYQAKMVAKTGKTYRYYLDEGKIAEDYWVDIETLNREDRERLGYPTQKPEALLERIITTSSNEGDVVLDAYCGCGTSVAVAQRLKRRWLGIASAIINDKKGQDRGFDGIAYFLTDKHENAKIVFQVKSGKVSRADIATLNNDRLREGAELAIFLTLHPPTKAMREETQVSGFYQHRLMNRTYPRIQIITIEEMLAGQQLDIPLKLEVLKQAQVVENAPQQPTLFSDDPSC